ncbi:RelA/SpoT domain-containing protein [Lentibacillus salinarum]|uniref:RelA/SpoT domain-containing protein n=1 Tax=Lentibacillus salinarum TaxID=446820 RepID=A0ABW3ZVQ3_9BACI
MKMKTYLQQSRLTEEKIKESGIEWGQLEYISNNYKNLKNDLFLTAQMLSNKLKEMDKAHIIHFRIKDDIHLLDKIIRKKLEAPNLDINVGNYTELLTDLIGIRVLHLYKEDREHIHQSINENWNLHEKPKANIRSGDSKEIRERYEQSGCDVKEHKAGYRSVHYLVKTKPMNKEYIAEVQVRTIFEEAWSEIDHDVRYPGYLEDPIINNYLQIFNRLAGNADEMGSFLKMLKMNIQSLHEEHKKEIEEKDKQIDDLKKQVETLEIDAKQKEKINKGIDIISGKIGPNREGILTKAELFNKDIDLEVANSIFNLEDNKHENNIDDTVVSVSTDSYIQDEIGQWKIDVNEKNDK